MNRKTIKKNCLNCNCIFEAQIRYVKKGQAKFCSIQCSGKYQSKNRKPKEPNIICSWCNKSFYRKPSKKNSKSNLYFCCRKHKDLAQRLDGLDKLTPIHYGTSNGYSEYYRKIAFENFVNKCDYCGFDEHKSLLEVHHIDCNRNNNDISNLRILCLMCHRKLHLNLLK